MTYTLDEVSKLTGLSKRALRFYEEKKLIKVKRNDSNYRFYDSLDLDRIQTILFLSAFELELNTVKSILDNPSYNLLEIYQTHLEHLYEKRARLDLIISNLTLTMDAIRRHEPMKDTDKFKGFKQDLVEKNDKLYQKEVTEKYGDDSYQKSKKYFMNMSESEYTAFMNLEQLLFESLRKASKSSGKEKDAHMHEAYLHHKAWITKAWGGSYDIDSHLNLCQMYLDDERFKKHYDDIEPGFAQLLFDCVKQAIHS